MLLLGLSKSIWSNVFNIWVIWLQDKGIKFEDTIVTHYEKNIHIRSQLQKKHQDYVPETLTVICHQTLLIHDKMYPLLQNLQL